MKAMFKFMACAAMICLGFQSCADEELVQLSENNHAEKELFTLTASQNTPSRLELGQDGMTIKWEPGDQLVLVKKDRSIVPIYMNADLEEPSVTANFVSESPVPAGEYHVIYNYNEHMVYSHHSFASIDDINNYDKMVLWGEVSVKEGDTSASISLQHLYAKIKVEVRNNPNNYSEYQIGMYASKSGFPIYRQINSNGLADVDYSYNYYENSYSYNYTYFPTNKRKHNIRLGSYNAYKYYDEMTGELNSNKEEIEKNSALILPADVSNGTLYFYILNGDECYEIPKSNVKFEAGKSYKVVLDMEKATKTTLKTTANTEFPFYQLTNAAECRHAAYRINLSRYMLMNEIDFKDDTYLPIIGCDYLDGNGYSLKNISIDWEEEDFVGMTLSDDTGSPGTISNLTLENIIIRGNNFVGTLGGHRIKANNCTIKGVSSIEGTGNYVGGLVGYNDGYRMTISDVSIESCEVKGNNNVGGIIGGYRISNYYDNEYSSSIKLVESCSSAANVTAKGDYVGGIFGNSDSGISISSCVNSGKIEGRNNVGGIGGSCFGGDPSQDVILKSVSEGIVKGHTKVGGILGFGLTTGINVCYSRSEISGTGTKVGGIIGAADMGSKIINSYSLATLSVEQGGYAGGIIGMCYTMDVSTENCYFAGINNTNCGIIGYSEGHALVKNCLTTLPSLGTNLGDHWQSWDPSVNWADIIENSLCNVQSILDNINIINNEAAYSEIYWPLSDYPAYCVKFATGLEGNVSAPGFGSDIEI